LTPTREPPPDTPYRRDSDYPRRYRDDRFRSASGPRTHRREVAALKRLLAKASFRPGPWLDVPAGAGRLTAFLPSAAVQVDRSPDMLRAAPADSSARVCASATALPFADDTFAGALCHRLLHHIPTSAERVRILAELARVTDGPVVLSVFHAVCLQNARRTLARRLGKRRSGRTAITLARILADLRDAGLRARAFAPLLPLVSEQWLILAERDERHGLSP
jgi:hypothetical protein